MTFTTKFNFYCWVYANGFRNESANKYVVTLVSVQKGATFERTIE